MPTGAKGERIQRRMDIKMREAGLSPDEPTFDDVTSADEWQRRSAEWEAWQDAKQRLQAEDFRDYPDDYVSDTVQSFYMDRWGNPYRSKDDRAAGVKRILAEKAADGSLNPHSVLIGIMKRYASEQPRTSHEDRWLRAAAALGDDNGREPMSLGEALNYKNRGWKRWIPVVNAMGTQDE